MTHKVILDAERSLDADKLCNQLRNKARELGPGSGCVDRIEWKAASVIRELLREREQSWTDSSDARMGVMEVSDLKCKETLSIPLEWHSDVVIVIQEGLNNTPMVPDYVRKQLSLWCYETSNLMCEWR